MSTVEERLAYLEAKIATLEEESSEALEANYLTYDPVAGVTGANFSGVIHATGLTLDAGGADANSIEWKRLSDGAMVARIFGQGITNHSLLSLFASNPDDGGNTFARLLETADALAAGNTSIQATAQNTFGGVHGTTVKVIDDLSKSSFIQDNNLGGRHFNIDGGAGTLTWGGVSASATVNIPNAVSFTTFAGILVSTSSISALGNIELQGTYSAGNPATFTVTGISFSGVPGAGTTLNFYWLAFGF